MLEFESETPFAAAITFIDMMDDDDLARQPRTPPRSSTPAAPASFTTRGTRPVSRWRAASAGSTTSPGTFTSSSRPASAGRATPHPPPTEWFHQLQDREVWEEQAEDATGSAEWTSKLAERSEADPAHFRTGDDLATALREMMERTVRFRTSTPQTDRRALSRAREVTLGTASLVREAARRTKLRLELRKLRSRIVQEEAEIGRLVYPLIAHGAIEVDSPEVQSAVGRLHDLAAELEAKEALAREAN